MGSKITRWVKSNLTIVICGTLALVSLVLIGLGFFLPEAQANLTADKSVYDGLQSAGGKAANERAIEDLRRKQNEVRRNVQNWLAAAAKSAPRTLLHPDVFPDAKERFDRSEFKDSADHKRTELLATLRAKDQPGPEEVADYREEVLKARDRERRESGAGTDGTTLVPGMPQAPVMPMTGGPGGPGYAMDTMQPTVIPENVTPEEWVKQDFHAGASVKRAQEVYCYASEASLDPRSLIPPDNRYPSAEIMWETQLSLWIQDDIIQALVRINNEVAGQLPEDQRWVAYLPVKHLLYIATGFYLPKGLGGGDGGGSMSGAMNAGGMGPVSVSEASPPAGTALFTKRQASETLDVVPLAVGLVIDANYLLRLLDEIGRGGFYTTLNVSYEAVPYDASLHGYIYGPAPVIRVRIELEHCILRDKLMIGDKKYLDLMPQLIKAGTYVSQNRGGPSGPSFGAPGMPTRGPMGPMGPMGPSRFRGDER